jgi:ketosteroid isomerase-like protein
LFSLFDENIEWTTPGPPELPTAGKRKGKQEVARFFDALVASFDVVHFKPKDYIDAGDRVVVIGDEVIRVKGAARGVEFNWVHVLDLRDGKIVRFREYGDTAPAVLELRAVQALAP